MDDGVGGGGEAKSKQHTHSTTLQYYNEIGARILLVMKQKDMIHITHISHGVVVVCIRNMYVHKHSGFFSRQLFLGNI